MRIFDNELALRQAITWEPVPAFESHLLHLDHYFETRRYDEESQRLIAKKWKEANDAELWAWYQRCNKVESKLYPCVVGFGLAPGTLQDNRVPVLLPDNGEYEGMLSTAFEGVIYPKDARYLWVRY